MVCADGVDDIFRFSVFLCQVTTDDGMGTLHLVVHGLTDIMQQSGSFCLFDIKA